VSGGVGVSTRGTVKVWHGRLEVATHVLWQAPQSAAPGGRGVCVGVGEGVLGGGGGENKGEGGGALRTHHKARKVVATLEHGL
jgi:hypothetical protein